MKIVGLTGGIGSGKTTVAKMFGKLGAPIYIADDEAKKLMDSSKIIKRKLIDLLGEETYVGAVLNRKYVADKIFSDKNLLEATNAIIHPEVYKHFNKWAAKQNSKYVIKEAAILFENGSYKDCDVVILVTASKEIRVARLLERDNTTVKAIEQRMKNQWSDAKKRKLADIIIENTDLESTEQQVYTIHNSLE